MVCEKCGQELNKGLKFCTKCGSIINTTPGKGILKVTGVLSVIVTAILIIMIVTEFIGIYIDFLYSIGLPFIIGFGSTVTVIIGIVLYPIMGIFCIKYSRNIEKTKLLISISIIVVVIDIVLLVVSHYFRLVSLVGFILPICLLIGAIMNLKAKGGN